MGLNLKNYTDAQGTSWPNAYACLGVMNVNWIGDTGNLPMLIYASKQAKADGKPPINKDCVLTLHTAPLLTNDTPPATPQNSMDDSKSSAYVYLASDMAARPDEPQFAPFIGSVSI